MQNKFGYHMCKDVSGDPYPAHVQVYLETTVQNIGTADISADTVQKKTTFNMETETVIPEPDID